MGATRRVLKTDSAVRLAPVYDFAPMKMDLEGITRTTRWEGFEVGGTVDWPALLQSFGADEEFLRKGLHELAVRLERLPELLRDLGLAPGDARLSEHRNGAHGRKATHLDPPMNRDDVARMRPAERRALLEELAAMVRSGELQLGEAVRVLRSGVLGMDRQSFSRAVKLSERAIAHLEDDPDGNPTLETMTRVLAPFGAKLGLVFPRMEEPSPLTDARQRQREDILKALAKSRRKRSGTAR